MAILFGYIYSPKGGPSSRIELGVVDLDQSAGSKGLIEALVSEETLEVKLLSEKEARDLIEPEHLVPQQALSELDAGSPLTWRVEALLPDGTWALSPRFEARVE